MEPRGVVRACGMSAVVLVLLVVLGVMRLSAWLVVELRTAPWIAEQPPAETPTQGSYVRGA